MFTVTRSSNLHFLKFWRFDFSNFQTTFVKIFTKRPPGFKIDFEGTDKVLRIHQDLWSEISRQWNNGPLTFFEICTEEPLASQILSNERNIKASILLILLKRIVVGYFNGSESFTGRLFSFYSDFHETFVKKFIKKLSFFSSNFKNPF